MVAREFTIVHGNMMNCLLIVFLYLPLFVQGQQSKDTIHQKVRNVFWTLPVSKNTTINGLAIGLEPRFWGKAKKLKINGLAISAAPWDIVPVTYSLFEALASFSRKIDTLPNWKRTSFNSPDLYPEPDSTRDFILTNGLILGSINAAIVSNGVNIVLMNTSGTINGLAISGLFNHHYLFRGVLIAGLRNKVTKGRGLQVALFNTCREGYVVQIGLINKIGNRIIPFVNLSIN